METKAKQYYLRKCDGCNKGMSEGILADDEYYCSEDCIKSDWDNKTFFVTEDNKELNYSQFIEYLDKRKDTESYNEFYNDKIWEWFNGCAEWFIEDNWGIVFDEQGKEYDIEEIQEENITEGE